MSEFVDLVKEFKDLKKEIFGNDMFVVMDENDPKTKRYNQLLAYFYPQFRTDGWKSPV